MLDKTPENRNCPTIRNCH